MNDNSTLRKMALAAKKRLNGASNEKQKRIKKEVSSFAVYRNLYKNDYKVALICHSLSWSIMISLPLILYVLLTINTERYYIYEIYFAIIILSNTIIHAYVDNLKANKHCINLVQDQLSHVAQIFALWIAVCQLI